jgi:hypothetical protein
MRCFHYHRPAEPTRLLTLNQFYWCAGFELRLGVLIPRSIGGGLYDVTKSIFEPLCLYRIRDPRAIVYLRRSRWPLIQQVKLHHSDLTA